MRVFIFLLRIASLVTVSARQFKNCRQAFNIEKVSKREEKAAVAQNSFLHIAVRSSLSLWLGATIPSLWFARGLGEEVGMLGS